MSHRPTIIIDEPEVTKEIDKREDETRKIFESIKYAQVRIREITNMNKEIDMLIEHIVRLTTEKLAEETTDS